MKWIGQHIWDFISRFRNDVYFEAVPDGTIASGKNLGLDSDNKLVKESDTGITDLHGAGVNGAANQLLTDDGDGTVTSEASFTFDGDTATISSATSLKPEFVLKSTTNDNKGSYFNFVSDKGGAGADSDGIGHITFYGDNSAQEQVNFCRISGSVNTALDTDEAGKLLLRVAASNGNLSSLKTGLELIGHGTDNDVDLNIGYGSTSSTTVAGTLTMGSTLFANNSGVIQVATQGTIDHDSLANFVAAEHYRWDTDISGTATINTNNITDLHGAGVDGSANQLLTDDGDGTVTSEAELLFDTSTNVLNVGAPGGGSTVYIQRGANDDNVGGRLYFGAGDAGGTDKSGGHLHILAGRGTGNAVGGSIFFQSTAAGSSGSSLNGLANIAQLDNVGNFEVLGSITTGSTLFANSSGVIQVATQGTIDHDSLANFEEEEHYRWDTDISATATINAANIPTLNQNTTGSSGSTTGNAATATTAQGITGATDGDVTITSDGHVVVKLDADNDESNQRFKITDNSDATVFFVQEDGNVLLMGTIITNSGSDNDLTLETDGSLIFTIDRDNDETSQKFSFVNFNAEVANIDETGVITATGFVLDGDKNITIGYDGQGVHIDASDMTDGSTSASGTNAWYNHITFENPRLLATNSSVTTTGASTVYIKGAPVEGTNQTITNAYALYVQAHESYFGGVVTANAGVTGDLTGNADTATNLVASTSTAVQLGTIELGHASDTTIARTAAGKVTIEGNEIQTKNVHHHFIHAGWFMSYPYSRYIPLNGSIVEQTTSTLAPEYTTFIWPYDGYVKTMWVRSETSLGSTEMKLYKGANGSTVSTAMGAVTETVGANTSVEFDMTGVTNSFSQGEAMAVRIDPTDDPDSGQNVTIECVFDLTT